MTPSETFRSSEVSAGMCGHCSQQNEPDAKFCGDCGQPLWESCQVCEVSSPIGRRFCRGCGGNLHEQVSQQLAQRDEQIRHALRMAKEHRYDEAIYLVRRQQDAADYRYEKLVQRAKRVLMKIASTRDQWLAKRDAAIEAAKIAAANEDHQRVIQWLQEIPHILLDDEAKALLTASKTANDQLSHCRSELKEALASRNYMDAGMVLNQLLTLEPDRTEYRATAEKVGKTLMKSAERQLQQGRYQEAAERLDAIPAAVRDEKANQMIGRVDDVLWMIRQFAREPFAFPRLGRLAQRLAKLVPEDARSKQLVQELVHAVKQPAPDPRQHVASWKGSDRSWLGSPIRILAFPQRMNVENITPLQKQPGTFSVAFGLALQGLGLGRVKDPLHAPKKKGFKKILQRRGRSECIGIDMGSMAVRAVHLRQSDTGEVKMMNCWQEAFEQPLCRAGLDTKVSDIRRQGLQRMAQRIESVDVPVWVNLPGRDVLGRFIRLPPMKDREVSALLDKEIDRQFPIARDNLMIARWLQSEKEANEGKETNDGSRCGALIACRDRIALERLALFHDAGIEPAAIQCDPLALVNFAAFEFQKQFAEQRCDAASSVPSLAFVDAGATAVTFLVVSGTAFWFRSLDGGGEDFTAQLARGGAMTAEQAEKCKRDPATLRAPAVHFAPIEECCVATGKRLQRTVKDADDFMPPFQTDAVWTFGGVSLMHGWISRVLGQQL